MDIKPHNLLCMACLCVGQTVNRISDEKCYQYYMKIVNEIPMPSTQNLSTTKVCFDCNALLMKSVLFSEQIKDSHRILSTYTNENLQECLFSEVSRPPRLKIFQNDSINILPIHIPDEILPVAPKPTKNNNKTLKNGIKKTKSIEEIVKTTDEFVKSDEELAKNEDLLDGEGNSVNQQKFEFEEAKLELELPEVKNETEACWFQSKVKVEENLSDYEDTEGFNQTEDCLFQSDDSDNLAELESEVKAYINKTADDISVKVKKAKKPKVESKKAKKVIKNIEKGRKQPKRTKRQTEQSRIRTLELTHDEMIFERNRDALRDSYIRAEFKCQTCLLGYCYEKSYKEHLANRHNPSIGEYTCPICKSVLSSADSFSTHYKRHMRRYECVACGKRTMDRKVMVQHVETVHEKNQREYKCSICGKISNSMDAHRYHRDTHKARVECTECNKSFSHRAGLMNHRLSVHKLKNKFPCTICDKIFRWKTSLKKHVEKHERRGKPLANAPYCEPCGVSFSSVCTYQRHMKNSLKHVTENELKFVCDHCRKKFANKTKLRDHIEEKHLYKTYQCHICHKPSKNRVCLDQHIRNVHKGRPNTKMCHHCGKGFPTKVQLDSHIRSHTGERPFICEFCPTTFSQQSNLYKHNRQVHMNIKAKRYVPNLKKRGGPSGPQTVPLGAPGTMNTSHQQLYHEVL